MPVKTYAFDATSASYPAPPSGGSNHINVGKAERLLSTLGGLALLLLGFKRGSLSGLSLTAAGGVLAYRGLSGHCPAYAGLGLDTSEVEHEDPSVVIRESITINKEPGALYAFWRDVENLPRFMHHLQSVRHIDEKHSEWTAHVPKNLGTVTWEAEVTDDRPGKEIAWRSLPGADVHNAGSVRFEQAPGGRGTEVHVTIEYRPPAGDLGAAAVGMLNPVFSQMVKEDIRRFKSLMEAGEIPTTEGQPAGR